MLSAGVEIVCFMLGAGVVFLNVVDKVFFSPSLESPLSLLLKFVDVSISLDFSSDMIFFLFFCLWCG